MQNAAREGGARISNEAARLRGSVLRSHSPFGFDPRTPLH